MSPRALAAITYLPAYRNGSLDLLRLPVWLVPLLQAGDVALEKRIQREIEEKKNENKGNVTLVD